MNVTLLFGDVVEQLRALLDLAGVPASGQVLADRALPSAVDLAQAGMFEELPFVTVVRAREFVEHERQLYERACRHLAETRGVRALQFLHGVDRVRS